MGSPLAASEWRRLADEVWIGLAEWRLAHPRATLGEIEAAVDERLAAVRARLVQDLARAGGRRTCAPASRARPARPAGNRCRPPGGRRGG